MNRTWIGADPHNYSVGRLWFKPSLIVLHWMSIGTITDEQEMLTACDAVFNRPNRGASAHFGIAGDNVHQYVKEEDTAWGASNILVNRQAINIEHAGSPLMPISDATYDTSAELIAHLAKTWGIPLDTDHVRLHREVLFANTQCPGNLDRDRILAKARTILDSLNNPEPTASVVEVPAAPSGDFTITVSGGKGSAYFRSEASTGSKVMAEYSNGTTIWCNATVTGQRVNGSDQWYKSRKSGWFIHSSVAKRN